MDKQGTDIELNKGTFFAASNSSEGFKSYYSEIFGKSGFEKVYIIKGGPGTGKSRFMREAAECAEALGASVRYYRCSSDPDSLDAIIIDERVVILDGTAPHAKDCEIVGARDELIDLGSFWDSARLSEQREKIEALVEKKSGCYKKAYRYLSACGDVAKVSDGLVISALRHKKMLMAVRRTLSAFDDGDGFEVTPALIDSVGMRGRVKFDTYEKCAEKLYCVFDWYSSAHYYLALLIKEAQRKNLKLAVSYDPILPNRVNSVYFYNQKTAFVIVEKAEEDLACGTAVNMKRFLDAKKISEIKKEFRANAKLYEALLSSAVESLCEAGESHFELEKIYSSCMDFSAKEKYTASFCAMLSGILKK